MAQRRSGCLCRSCWGQFCESRMGAMKGQMCVPLLCPFSDLLKAASAPREKNPGTSAVPAVHLVQCPCGSASALSAWAFRLFQQHESGRPLLGRARGAPHHPWVFLSCADRGEIMSLVFRVLLG